MSSNTTAIASGVRAAWASNSSGSVPCGTSRAVSFHSDRIRWRSAAAEDVDVVHRGLRVGRDRLRVRAGSRRVMSSTVTRSNRSVANVTPPRSPAGVPSVANGFAQAEVQVELGRLSAGSDQCGLDTGQVEDGLGVVLQGEHDLEQGVAGQGAGRGEFLHQPLERHVLVGEGRPGRCRGPGRAAR